MNTNVTAEAASSTQILAPSFKIPLVLIINTKVPIKRNM